MRSRPRPVSMLWLGEVGQRAVGMQPWYCAKTSSNSKALGVVARPVVGAAELGAAVEIELEQGPHGPVGPDCQVVVAAERHDALVGDPDGAPAVDRLLVGAEPQLTVPAEHADPDLLGLEPEALRGELVSELHGACLEGSHRSRKFPSISKNVR